ncbi:uncharacterized protein LOC128241812 isoform X2 [Mya arenaria]|uniref:uncharacterized protein LOC128241812 isoform X2 n=1 Tax=Mya arenaria TaxID=6604 RepID=UPI0022DF071A|nr:uncharacterized protein LOC128241812 isoform X2 [Mya arenaria]
MEDEDDYFVRIWLSVFDCGTATLRQTLMKVCENERPLGTDDKGWSLDHLLSDHQVKILSNFKNRADGRQKKNQLFPIGSKTNIEEWDLQLVVFILKIVGNLEQSVGKAVDALQNLRNKLCHMKETKLSIDKYTVYRSLSKDAVTYLLNFIQNENVKEEMLKRLKTIHRCVVVDKNKDWNCRDVELKDLMTRVKAKLEPLSKADEDDTCFKCSFTADEAANVGEEARLVINLLNDVKTMLTSKEIKVEVPDTSIELVIRNYDKDETHRISEILVNMFVEVRDQIESNHGNNSLASDDEYAGVKTAIKHIIRKLAEDKIKIRRQRNKCVQLDISCDEISTFLALYEKCISGELTSLIEPLEEEVIKVTGNDCIDIDVVMPETSFWSCVIKFDVDFVLYETLKRKEIAHIPESKISEIPEGAKTLFLRDVNAILEPSFQSPSSRLALSLCHTESEGSINYFSPVASPCNLDDDVNGSVHSWEQDTQEVIVSPEQITQEDVSPGTDMTRFETERTPSYSSVTSAILSDSPLTPRNPTSEPLKGQKRNATSDDDGMAEREENESENVEDGEGRTTEIQLKQHDEINKEDNDLPRNDVYRSGTPRRRRKRRKTKHATYMTKLRAFQKDLIRFYVLSCETAPVSPRSSYRINVPKIFVSPDITEMNTFTKTTMRQSTNQTATYNYLFGIDEGVAKNVCICGEMGVGKSIVCNMIVLQWCHAHDDKPARYTPSKAGVFNDGYALKIFSVVFYIQLSKVKGVCRVDEMIKRYIIDNLARSTDYNEGFITQTLLKEKCLLILDGLDKWTHPEDGYSTHECRDISSLPHMTNWPNMVTITTSRPWKVWKTPELAIDRCFVLQGVKSNTVEQLFENYIKELPSTGSRLKRSFVAFKQSGMDRFEDMFTKPAVLVRCLCLWLEGHTSIRNVCESILSMCFENTRGIYKLMKQAKAALKQQGVYNVSSNAGLAEPLGSFQDAQYINPTGSAMDETLVPFQDVLYLLGKLALSTYPRDTDHCRVDLNAARMICNDQDPVNIGVTTGVLICQNRASLLKNNLEYKFVNKSVRDYLMAVVLSTDNRLVLDVSQKLLKAKPSHILTTTHDRKTVRLNEMDDLCGVLELLFDINNNIACTLQGGITDKTLEIMKSTHFAMNNDDSCMKLFRTVQNALINAATEIEGKGEVAPFQFVLYEKLDKDEQDQFEVISKRYSQSLNAIVVNGRDIDETIVSSIHESEQSLRLLDLSNTDTIVTLPVTANLEKLKLYNVPFSNTTVEHLDLSTCKRIGTFLAENVRIQNINIENETLCECLIKGCFSFSPSITIAVEKVQSLRRLVLHRVSVNGPLDLNCCHKLEEIDLNYVTVSDVTLKCETMRVCKLTLIGDKVATNICKALRSSKVLEEIELSFLSLDCHLDLLNSPVLSKVKLVEITVDKVCVQTRNLTDCSLWYLNKEATVSIINSMKQMINNTAVFEFATREKHEDVTQLIYQFLPSMVHLQRLTIADFDIGDNLVAPQSIQDISFCRTAITFRTFQKLLVHILKLRDVVECRLLKCTIEPENEFNNLKKVLELSHTVEIITDDKSRQDFRFRTVKEQN